MPAHPDDPLEAMLDFSGPTDEPDDPVLARLFPTAYPDDPEAAGDFRRFTEGTLRDGKAAAAISLIDALEEAGLPPELKEDGLVIDVELDEDAARAWMRSFTDLRLALATRLEVEEGDQDYWDSLARRRPPRSGPRHLSVGGLPPRDPGRRADVLSDSHDPMRSRITETPVGWPHADPGVHPRDPQDDRAARDVAARRHGGRPSRGDEVLLGARADNGAWTPITGIPEIGEEPGHGGRPRGAGGDRCRGQGRPAGIDERASGIVHANGDRASYLDLTFACTYVSGEAHVADDESMDVRWFPRDALPEMAAVMSRRIDDALSGEQAARFVR